MAKKQRRRVRDTDPELVYGRTVEVTMRELTGDFSKQYIKLQFEVNDVNGNIANTKFTGHKTTTDYVRSMIRRGTSRIDAPVIVTTQDERKLKLHVLAVTTRRAKSSQQKFMRETINELVTKVASEKTFDELVENSVNGRLALLKFTTKLKKSILLKEWKSSKVKY